MMTKEEFKQARKNLGLSQIKMAEKLGYSRVMTISDKENGKRSVTRQDEIILNYLKNNKENT